MTLLFTAPHDKQEQRNKERKILTIAIGAGLLLLSFIQKLDTNFSETYLQPGKHQETDVEQGIVQRTLSLNLGNGNCQWTQPNDAPEDRELFSTLLVAFPGSGKRAAFMQLEGLTELKTGDDYHLSPNSLARKYAFVKTNYPQHDGIWSFGSKMDQVILVVRNPRWTLPSYQHLLHEIDYSINWETSYALRHNVYTMRPPIEDWIVWRELRFDVEIKKWGWFIDFWMEGGLCRDVFTNDLTTPEHFERLTQPVMYAEAELIAEQEFLEGVPPVIHEHCKSDLKNCKPVAIASYERILDPETGPSEVDRFAAAIEGKAGLSVIAEEARECVWKELIVNGKGNANTYRDRDGNGPDESQYDFTLDQMYKIQDEIVRMREKYSTGEWVGDSIAEALVEYLDSYLAENDEEIRFMS